MASTITSATETKSIAYFEVANLPIGLTIEQVYSDYIRYLIEHTKVYFEATSVTGDKIWEKLFKDVSSSLSMSAVRETLISLNDRQHLFLRIPMVGVLCSKKSCVKD